ncbi:MAG: terpene cyclase/mutase family protein [Planctomycetia bacterium]|nr:terpene cyclase/mutase family protein [Planctomycetia bacterium]
MSLFLKYLPNPARVLQAVIGWAVTNGIWWATSVMAHIVVISGVLLLLGKVTAPPKEGDAPLFEANVNTEIPEPQIDHFDPGQTPIEPTELNTETLSLVDAPRIDADQPMSDSADAVTSGGGSAATATGGIGGLDQFAVKAIGPGPLVRGSGLAGSGTGRGAGSGAGTGFGARGDKDARKAMVGGYGGTKASERAVAAALNWLARHQSPEGSWSLEGFSQFCKGEPCSGPGAAKSDVAAAAMALLPFLAAGQTHHTKGPYRKTIDLGLAWIINRQKQNGDLRDGAAMYTHGLAAITLCEAYGLSKDSRVGLAAQAAIRFIEESQNDTTGGWHYAPKGLGDTSVVGWQIMALKSAQMAGLSVGEPAISGSHKWLKSVTHGTSGGLFSYNTKTPATPTMTAVGLLCTQYLGARRQDPAIQEGLGYLTAHLPNANARNCYYWYYATQVMHNLPGPEWDTWNREMRRVLIESQIKDGCAAGSWDPAKPTPDPWQAQGGRIMVTSLCCLTLEVYYRYLPLYKLDAEDKLASDPQQTASASTNDKPGK